MASARRPAPRGTSGRSRWLLDPPVDVRRSTDGKSMRLTCTRLKALLESGR